MGSLKSGNEDEGASDDESRQGFYVGGSDHSGQQVLGPQGGSGRGRRADGLADQVFEAARRAGAETLGAAESERYHERTSAQSSSGQSISG